MQGQSSSSPLALRNPPSHSAPPPPPPPSRIELDDADDADDARRPQDVQVDVPTPLLSQVTASLPFASASSRVAGGSAGAPDVMEMKPIVEHRRRKSSLMTPDTLGVGVGPGRPSATDRDAAFVIAPGASGSSPGPASAKEESGAAGMDSPSDDKDNDKDNDDDNDDDDDDDHNYLRNDEETGLSNKERARRQKSRLRNMQLGQRVARDRTRDRTRDSSRDRSKSKSRSKSRKKSRNKSLSAEEREEANKDVAKRLLVNGVLILMWYFFSLSISLYNKWMFDRERLNFAFPLFTTSMHMVVQFCLSALVLYLVPSLRPAHGHTSDLGRSRHETEANNSSGARTSMTKLFYITRVGPCGAATGLDIGLGNTSLKFISLTFYTMCKSSSLAFVLLFAFVFGLEKPTWRLVGIIATMTMGVVLMVSGEVEFRFSGFLLVISAAAFSGFRWSLTQMLLLRNPATSNPFSSIFYLTPIMFLTIILIAVPVEGLANFWAGLGVLSDQWGGVLAPLFLLFPGCIAFLMTASEFALLKRTSVVTLSIAGIFKEVVTISAASLVFKDRLTLVNAVGLVTTMVAIIAYNYIKITKMRDDARVEVHGRVAHSPSPRSNLDHSTSDADNDDSMEETAGLLGESAGWGETR